MAAWEQNVRLMLRWQEKLEADRTRIIHDLVIQRRFRGQLALGVPLGLRELLLVPSFKLG